MSEAPRIGCVVPGCRRTFKDEGQHAEVMCGKHWRMAPIRLRNRNKKLHAAYRSAHRWEDWQRCQRIAAVELIVWDAIKASVIGTGEKPAGLDAALDEVGLRCPAGPRSSRRRRWKNVKPHAKPPP